MGGESLEDSAREMGELKGKLLQQQAAMREALSVMAAAFRRQLRQLAGGEGGAGAQVHSWQLR